MTLRKIFTLGIILAMFLVAPAVHAAVVVMWDSYTDDRATHLVLESSTNNSTWNTTYGEDPIDKGLTGTELTAPGSEILIYYRLKAVGTDGNGDPAESTPSNTISFDWDGGGGGTTGLGSPGGFGFVDCDNVTSASAEEQACIDAGVITP